MSSSALEYYSGFAEHFGNDAPIPEVLSGRAYILSEPDQRIFVRDPDFKGIPGKYESILADVGGFVLHNAAPEDLREGDLATLAARARINNAQVKTLLENRLEGLIPRTAPAMRRVKLTTGYLCDVQVEAYAPSDLPETALARAYYKQKALTEASLGHAYLLTSAELVMGTSRRSLAHLTVVGLQENSAAGYGFNSRPIGYTELRQMPELVESRKSAAYLSVWKLLGPTIQSEAL